MYSASPRTVRMELADTGFKVVVVDPGRSPIGLTSPWFYYVGRKV